MPYYGLKPGEYPIDVLYDRMREITVDAFEDQTLNSRFLPLIHHSRIAGVTQIPEIRKGIARAVKEFPSNTVHSVHYPFDPKHRVTGKSFTKDLLRFLPWYEKWGISSAVMHPSKGKENTIGEMVDIFADPKLTSQLEKSSVTLAVENMNSEDDFFADLDNLVQFREQLLERYSQMGLHYLTDQIAFCFDTGHYLKYAQEKGIDPKSQDMTQKLVHFSSHVKVFHISTNTGFRDNHVFIRDKKMPLPPNKAKDLRKSDPEQNLLVKNSHQMMEWLKVCVDHRHPTYALEFLHEVNDFITPETLAYIGKWMNQVLYS